MPLVRIIAEGTRASAAPSDDLDGALARHPAGAPVVILIHGYKFRPGDGDRCPHEHILSLSPRPLPRAVSWPRHLGFGRGGSEAGICLAFGWNASGSIWRANRRAAEAADALSGLVRRIAASTRQPVDIVAHSLGARVALEAVARAPAGTIGRVILLAAAVTRSSAEQAIASPAGRLAEFVNVRSRENAVFDLLFRAAILPHPPSDRTLGAGLGRDDENWLDLAIDCPRTRRHLEGLGFRIPEPARRFCHWSGYLRPGLFALYRALLREGLPLAAIRAPERPPCPRRKARPETTWGGGWA